MRRATTYALLVYLVVSLGALVSLAAVKMSPDRSLGAIVEQGPGTNAISLIVSLGLTWVLIGGLIVLVALRKITSSTAVPVILGAALSLLYLAFLREHVYFSDYPYFIGAAMNILAGEPFHELYVYPPLWASFLATIYGAFGRTATVLTCFTVNHVSIVAFFFLASVFLSRCGLSLNLSSVLVFCSLIVNAPVLRNIVYVQMNFAMLDLVLASVLLFPRSKFFSAASLALGAHLKVVPALFAPLVLTTRKWRWLAYFLLTGIAVALLTVLSDGASYYLDFWRNFGKWRLVALRSCSIYGFLVSTGRQLGLELPIEWIWNAIRAPMTLGLVGLSWLAIRRRCFARIEDGDLERIINGMVPLFFLMVVVAPTVWPHHLVVLIVPALLVVPKIASSAQGLLFGVGYFFTFLLPVFDGYPWSYLRLGGWLILLGLTAWAVLRGPFQAGWVELIDRSLSSLVESCARAFRDRRPALGSG